MSWCIAFPYCPNEPIRQEAFELVSGFYTKHFPKVPQIAYSSTPVGERFLRAKTRNALVNIAQRGGYDVVALIDADTLVHPDSLSVMVNMAHERDMFLGKPFLKGDNMPIEKQRQLVAGLIEWPNAQFNDPGAAWVIRPESWWKAGGMDEAITSWGGEDSAFMYLFAALRGETSHGTLPAVKTEHVQPRWSQDPEWSDTLKRELVTKAIWAEHPHLATEWLQVRHQAGIVDTWIRRLDVALPFRHFPNGLETPSTT
jgi:hypothetical protein